MKNILALVVFTIISWTVQAQSTLVFTYDASGNQIKREFRTNSAKRQVNPDEEVAVTSELIGEKVFSDQIKVYPNPTEGLLKLEWNPSLTKKILRITASQLSGTTWEIPVADSNQNSIEVDLTQNANGVKLT